MLYITIISSIFKFIIFAVRAALDRQEYTEYHI